MALLTPLSSAQARPFLLDYGIDLRSWVPLAEGSVNSNFLLSGKDGREYFARIYEEQGLAGARFELELNEALGRAGVPVAKPVRRRDGELVSRVEGKPFAVYERASGESLCQKMVTPEVARGLGHALAEVHQADLGGLEVPQGRFDRAALLVRLELVERSGRAALVSASARVRSLLTDLDARRDPDLPRGLIHGDLFRDNVLVAGSRVSALLDFESACQGSYAYDLMVTVLAWCYGERLDTTLARAMIEGYHAVRRLSSPELAALASEGAMACARFAVTRMTDFSLRVEEGQEPGRDYRRFFARLEALEADGLDPVVAGLA